MTTLHYVFLKKFRNIDRLRGVGLQALRRYMMQSKSESMVSSPPEDSHPAYETTVIVEMKREIEIKTYEVSELTNKLTKANE